MSAQALCPWQYMAQLLASHTGTGKLRKIAWQVTSGEVSIACFPPVACSNLVVHWQGDDAGGNSVPSKLLRHWHGLPFARTNVFYANYVDKTVFKFNCMKKGFFVGRLVAAWQ